MKILTLLYTIPICNKLRCYSARKRIAKGYKLRTNDEIFKKKRDIDEQLLIAGRTKNADMIIRCEAQLQIIEWLLG